MVPTEAGRVRPASCRDKGRSGVDEGALCSILFKYLSLAQINGNMHGSKQLAQRKKDATSQESVLVEDDLYEVAASIPTQKATNMKDIAHHAQRAIVRQRLTARQRYQLGLLRLSWGRSVEPLMSPDKHIVSQAAQEHQHLLGFKTLFVAFGQADARVSFEASLDAAASLVVERDRSPQHRLLISRSFQRHACQVKHCLIRKRTNQHTHAPLTVGFARANRNPTNRAHKSGWLLAHPSDLSRRLLSIGNPVLDSSRQQTRLLPRTRFAQHLIALFQEPIQVGHASASSVDAHQRTLTLLSVELQRVLSSGDQRLPTNCATS